MKRILLLVCLLLPVTASAQSVLGDRFVMRGGPCTLRSGAGDPNTVVTGKVCDTYWRTDTGQIYQKMSGTGNTGWVVNGISGSGTVGTIPKWTTTSSLGDSSISEVGTDIVVNPPGKDILPNLGFDINIGSLPKKFLTLHAAELWVETLVAQNTMATIGGRVIVAPTNILSADIGPANGSITTKYNNMINGDRVYLEANGKVEFMAITSNAGGAGPYTYSVTRNLDGSGADTWNAGDAILNTGQTGNGFIDIYSVRGVHAATEVGPTIVGNVRNSSTFNDWSPRWAMGNLNGLYGYGTNTYGVALGDQAHSWISLDPTNGLRMLNNATTFMQITPTGSAFFAGDLTVGTGRNLLRNSECRDSTADWSVGGTSSGLTVTLDFSLSPWRLNDEANTCYAAILTGTPANATQTFIGNAQLFPVTPGTKYETSAYLGTHRSNSSWVAVNYYNSVGTLISQFTGNHCTTANAGGVFLSGYCRSGVISTAPTGTATAQVFIFVQYDGLDTTPYVFWVRTYFGEAGPQQTVLSPWGGAGMTEVIGGMIKTDTITAREIAAATITATEIAANTITAGNIAANTITAAKIAAGTITSTEIAANTIVAADIAAGTITGTEIAASTITAAKLNVTSLSAISANLGTVTAGTISGVTINAGSGNEVTLNSTGITLSGGTGTNNRLKWSDGSSIYGVSGDTFVDNDLSVNGSVISTGTHTVQGNTISVVNVLDFANMPVSTGTPVVWETACGCLKKTSSSLRYKENITEWAPKDPLGLLNAKLIRYDYRNGGTANNVGLSADDLATIDPVLVNMDKQGRPDSVNQSALNAYLIATIKALQKEVADLKKGR